MEEVDLQMSSLRAQLEECNAQMTRLDQEVEGMHKEIGGLVPDPDSFERLQSLFSRLEELEDAEKGGRDNFPHEGRVLVSTGTETRKSEASLGQEDAQSIEQIDAALSDERVKWQELRSTLAKRSRAVSLLSRKVDEVPVRAELMQYERRFVELSEEIRWKLQETRKYYATYNSLMDSNKVLEKEISFLGSIQSRFDQAIATPQGREKLLESLSAIAASVKESEQKAEQKVKGEQEALSMVKNRHATAVAAQRQYFALLKQLQEECTRGERLHQTLQKKAMEAAPSC
ncbi:hypothetical protein CBR_g51241 [Chara braunii]|uniref:CCDC93 coiled-coil domain-containing protein n=1 Tax=Chara braunii TaxID=69332 RepID=A0A388M821_CHABU|nr:hypothetical protein CBR_g51241 [Chara braunii]|eukprot:GBG90734.1 hypothetical protein CBR_g51241 [Chara braunii]